MDAKTGVLGSVSRSRQTIYCTPAELAAIKVLLGTKDDGRAKPKESEDPYYKKLRALTEEGEALAALVARVMDEEGH